MAWEHVQRPLHLGGLGVLDLNLFGIALRTRWLWLCYMDTDHPWAFMTIAADRQTSSFFFALVHFRLGNGRTFIFWVDPWLDGKWIIEIAPQLVDVIPCRRQRQLSISQALHGMVWNKDIKGALIIQCWSNMYRIISGYRLFSSRLPWRTLCTGIGAPMGLIPRVLLTLPCC
jgi:hypothetical protein